MENFNGSNIEVEYFLNSMFASNIEASEAFFSKVVDWDPNDNEEESPLQFNNLFKLKPPRD